MKGSIRVQAIDQILLVSKTSMNLVYNNNPIPEASDTYSHAGLLLP